MSQDDADKLFAHFPHLRGQLESLVQPGKLVRIAPLELRPTIVTRLALLPVFGILGLFLYDIAHPLVVASVAGYLASWVAIARRRIIVDDDGIMLRGAWSQRRLAWDEIDHYTYWAVLARGSWVGDPVNEARLLDSAYAGVDRVRHKLCLITADGRRLKVDSFFRGTEAAVRRILDQLHVRLALRPTSYAPYTITEAGLAHSDLGVLPWAELEKVVVSSTMPPDLRVMKDRKILPWSRTSLDKIHNSMLLLEYLAARGVVIDPGSRSFVSRGLFEHLVRAQRLPRAELARR